MRVLGIDFETTGLNVAEDRIIEIGAVFWDTNRKCPLRVYNELVRVDAPLKPEITAITGITDKDLQLHGKLPVEALEDLWNWLHEELFDEDEEKVIVGHNCLGFDKPLLEAEFKRHKFVEPKNLVWLDTSVDVPYPESMGTRKLTYLATEHGFLNPFAHRAFSDVLTMLKILSEYDVSRVVGTAKEPSVSLLAVVKKPWEDTAPEGKKQTDVAKSLGFRWNGNIKRWVKIVKKSQVEAEVAKASFDVIIGD